MSLIYFGPPFSGPAFSVNPTDSSFEQQLLLNSNKHLLDF